MDGDGAAARESRGPRPSGSSQRTVVVADAVFAVSTDPLVGAGPGSVAVAIEDGRIAATGPAAALAPRAAEAVDLSGCVVIPGLVNAHTHLQYSCFGGAIATRRFFDWIRALTGLIGETDSAAWLASSRLGALENLRGGVTSVADVFSRDESLAALGEAGLGGVAFYELIGPNAAEAGRVAAQLERRLEGLGDATARIGAALGISPHAPYTCHPSLYVAARRIADREALPVATHVSETRDEVDLFADGSGPLAAYATLRSDDFEPPHATPIRYLDDLGFWAGGRALAIHAVHATPGDIRLLAERGASVVTCPSSNAALGAGRADVAGMLEARLLVALGSDSLASTAEINLLKEMGELLKSHHPIDPERLLAMATRDSAEALGLAPGTGTLAPGAPADLAAFRTPSSLPASSGASPGARRSEPGRDLEPSRVLRDLFAAAPSAAASMRHGRWLVFDGEPTKLDAASVETEAASVTKRLKARAGSRSASAERFKGSKEA